MGRRVITLKDVATLSTPAGLRPELEVLSYRGRDAAVPGAPSSPPPAATTAPDDYVTKLLKFIPAEVVAGYVAVDGIIRSATQIPVFVYWIVFCFFLVLTPVYIWRISTAPGLPPAKAQIIIATFAFIVWAFALGGPFGNLDWYLPAYGAILLVVYTVTIPVLAGK